jgi:hypothetical protein
MRMFLASIEPEPDAKSPCSLTSDPCSLFFYASPLVTKGGAFYNPSNTVLKAVVS